MNNIEILEEFIEKNIKSRLRTELNANELQAIENLIQENKELKERCLKLESDRFWDNVIPKSKVKELAKKYEFALNDYDSSTADYKHSQNLGRYMACVELLKEGE